MLTFDVVCRRNGVLRIPNKRRSRLRSSRHRIADDGGIDVLSSYPTSNVHTTPLGSRKHSAALLH